MNTRAYLEGYLTKQAASQADYVHTKEEGKKLQGEIDKAKADGSYWAKDESPLPPAIQAAPITAAPPAKKEIPIKK